MSLQRQSVGDEIREWRRRRRLSQLDLAGDAEISARHLSFIETGRAQPSRAMLLRLAEQLGMPLRQRNALLVAGGYAPLYAERRLDDPELAGARRAIGRILAGHMPYPALAIDRHWNLVEANAAVLRLVETCAPHLLAPPVNVLRLALHPDGLAPRTRNLREWRDHLLRRLGHEIERSGDTVLAALLGELETYPSAPPHGDAAEDFGGIAVPLRIAFGDGELALISATTLFGSPIDVTLSEIAIESFFPADEATAARLAAAFDAWPVPPPSGD